MDQPAGYVRRVVVGQGMTAEAERQCVLLREAAGQVVGVGVAQRDAAALRQLSGRLGFRPASLKCLVLAGQG